MDSLDLCKGEAGSLVFRLRTPSQSDDELTSKRNSELARKFSVSWPLVHLPIRPNRSFNYFTSSVR